MTHPSPLNALSDSSVPTQKHVTYRQSQPALGRNVRGRVQPCDTNLATSSGANMHLPSPPLAAAARARGVGVKSARRDEQKACPVQGG